MANITDGIQIRSGSASDEFYALLQIVLLESFLDLYNKNREEIYSRFNGFSGDGQHQMLVFLRSISPTALLEFHSSLRFRFIAVDVDSIFRALESTLTMFAGILQATEISPYGDPGASSSSTAAASHGEMSNNLQSHYQRPAASHNNPPGNDVVINIRGEGEFTSVHQTIPAEARATRDGETAGHSKFFETLLPVNFKYALKAGDIVKSTYHILPPSIKISGCLAVASAFVAAFSALAGFSLSTFRPSTLPFGWNPQLMLQIMHISTVFSLGFAFIGIMCHEFLRDDPIIFWMVVGLAYAVLTAVLVVIIRRR